MTYTLIICLPICILMSAVRPDSGEYFNNMTEEQCKAEKFHHIEKGDYAYCEPND